MHKSLVLLCVVLIAACSKNASTDIVFPVMPPELKDCKFHYLQNEDYHNIHVVRCPLSVTTTTTSNKQKTTVVVIDGVEYTAKEK